MQIRKSSYCWLRARFSAMGLREQLKEQSPGFQKGTYSGQMNQQENKGAFLKALHY